MPFSDSKIVIQSPIGPLALIIKQNLLTHVVYQGKEVSSLPFSHLLNPNIEQIITWFEQYFSHPCDLTKLNFNLQGTSFQKKVWLALLKIPIGQTLTYGELAQSLCTSPRAIGMACKSNPLPIVVPCHRVVAKNHLGGYCGSLYGDSMRQKHWLLEHERYHSGRAYHDDQISTYPVS